MVDCLLRGRVWVLAVCPCDQQPDFGISPWRIAHTELRAKRQRLVRESGRQVECPYIVASKESALGAGSDIPNSAYCAILLVYVNSQPERITSALERP